MVICLLLGWVNFMGCFLVKSFISSMLKEYILFLIFSWYVVKYLGFKYFVVFLIWVEICVVFFFFDGLVWEKLKFVILVWKVLVIKMFEDLIFLCIIGLFVNVK